MINNKIVVGIDMDSTSVQLVPKWIEKISEYYNINISIEEIVDDNMHDIVESCKNKFGLSEYEIKKPFYEVGFWRSLPPMNDAVEVIKKMLNDELYFPIIVTRPQWKSNTCVKEKFEWVLDYLGSTIPFVATEHKYLISSMDFLIDDNRHNLDACRNHGIKTIKFNQPWNKNIQSTYSVDNWKEIDSLLL